MHLWLVRSETKILEKHWLYSLYNVHIRYYILPSFLKAKIKEESLISRKHFVLNTKANVQGQHRQPEKKKVPERKSLKCGNKNAIHLKGRPKSILLVPNCEFEFYLFFELFSLCLQFLLSNYFYFLSKDTLYHKAKYLMPFCQSLCFVHSIYTAVGWAIIYS